MVFVEGKLSHTVPGKQGMEFLSKVNIGDTQLEVYDAGGNLVFYDTNRERFYTELYIKDSDGSVSTQEVVTDNRAIELAKCGVLCGVGQIVVESENSKKLVNAYQYCAANKGFYNGNVAVAGKDPVMSTMDFIVPLLANYDIDQIKDQYVYAFKYILDHKQEVEKAIEAHVAGLKEPQEPIKPRKPMIMLGKKALEKWEQKKEEYNKAVEDYEREKEEYNFRAEHVRKIQERYKEVVENYSSSEFEEGQAQDSQTESNRE